MPASTHSSTSGNGCQGALGGFMVSPARRPPGGVRLPATLLGTSSGDLHHPPAHEHPEQAGTRADVVGRAPGQAEVLVAKAPPPVGGRVGEHPLEDRKSV